VKADGLFDDGGRWGGVGRGGFWAERSGGFGGERSEKWKRRGRAFWGGALFSMKFL
jgi:hypothetical protein